MAPEMPRNLLDQRASGSTRPTRPIKTKLALECAHYFADELGKPFTCTIPPQQHRLTKAKVSYGPADPEFTVYLVVADEGSSYQQGRIVHASEAFVGWERQLDACDWLQQPNAAVDLLRMIIDKRAEVRKSIADLRQLAQAISHGYPLEPARVRWCYRYSGAVATIDHKDSTDLCITLQQRGPEVNMIMTGFDFGYEHDNNYYPTQDVQTPHLLRRKLGEHLLQRYTYVRNQVEDQLTGLLTKQKQLNQRISQTIEACG